MNIKLILISILLCSCSYTKKQPDSFTQVNEEQQLFEWLLENEHRIEENNLNFGNILENVKNHIPLKDYYFYAVQINILDFNNMVSDIDFLEKSDQLGNPEAGEYIYDFYYPNDFHKRVKYLESSANKGNANSQFTLGILYFYGRRDFKIDKEKGFKLLQQSAWGGSPQALLTLGEAKFEPLLGTEEFQFWRVINGLYESTEENEDKFINIDVELSKITNKPKFCTKYKQYVLNNIIPHKDYYSNIYPNLLKVLGGCMMKR